MNREQYPKVVRIASPIITPEELLEEVCAERSSERCTVTNALATASLVLSEELQRALAGFRYRDQIASPRAVWARCVAVALDSVTRAIAVDKDIKRRVAELLETHSTG